MIGRLTGTVGYYGQDHLLLDVGGVGYLIYCSDATLRALPPIGEIAMIYTDLLVREDNLQLFGFLTPQDKAWHQLLVTVQGVGAKAALAIASTLGIEGISRAITLGDVAAIKAAPGVGPKIAQRIVTELKDKAPAVLSLSAPFTQSDQPGQVIETTSDHMAEQAEALSALVNLGYPQMDAAQVLAEIAQDLPDGADTSQLIKAALQRLASA